MSDNQPLTTGLLDKPSHSKISLATLLFVVLGGIYLMTVNIMGKVGLGEVAQYTLVLAFPIAGCIFVAFSTRILGQSGLVQFVHGGGLNSALHNGLAGAAEWLSLFFIIGVIAAFSTTNHLGLALMAGAFAGMVFLSVLILPKLPADQADSPVQAIFGKALQAKKGASGLRVFIACVVIICAFAFLVAQIGAGAQIVNLHFPMSRYWAATILLAPLLLVLLAGGMRGLTLANILLYWVIAAAVILPAIWLSLRITGNPIPQFSFGSGALQPILQLEQQLTQSAITPIAHEFEQGNFAPISGFSDFFLTIVCIMAGTATLPMMYARIACTSTKSERIRSLGATLIFSALILSIIPAFVTFMKFEIYRDIVGLPINQLGDTIDWLFNWSRLESGHHALICSKPATDIASIIAACGKGAEHVLVPSDLQFSPLMTFLGAGEIASMPSVYSAIAYAGVLSAAITTAGIALMVIVNTANSEFFFHQAKKQSGAAMQHLQAPISRQLFVSRILIITLAAFAVWVSQNVPVPVTDFTLWAFAISAGALFPIQLMTMWWSKTTVKGAIAGLATGFGVTIYFLLTIEYGPDWIARNGDEPIFLIPFSNEPLSALNSGVVGLCIATITVFVISLAERSIIHSWKSKLAWKSKFTQKNIKKNGR